MRLFFILFVFALGAGGAVTQIDREARAAREITRYINDWARNVPRSRRRALRHVASAAHWSVQYNVDPLLVAERISLESSWNAGALGEDGEVGLMQVHAPAAKRDFDLTDPDEQIHAGVRWLRICISTCGGSIPDGLNNYLTGRCRPHLKKIKYLMKRWNRAVRLFRSVNSNMDSGDALAPAAAPPDRLKSPPL